MPKTVSILASFLLLVGVECVFAQTITIDDFDSQCELVGVWADNKTNGFSAGGTFKNGYHYTSVVDPFKKTGREQAIYTPNLPKAGNYRVEVTYRATSNRSKQVTYEVRFAGGRKRRTVDQSRGDGVATAKLGTFPFKAGTGGSVVLTGDGGGSASADAARFVFAGEAGDLPPDGLDDVLDGVGGGGGGGAGGNRLDSSNPGSLTYTFPADGMARIAAKLSTYGPARIEVILKTAAGEESELMSWSRQDDMDPSPLLFKGQPVEESMQEVKPGDFSPVKVSRSIEGKKGDQLILTLDGNFGDANPMLSVKGPAGDDANPGAPGTGTTTGSAGGGETSTGTASGDDPADASN